MGLKSDLSKRCRRPAREAAAAAAGLQYIHIPFRTDPQGWELEVEDSPFAAGFGPAEAAVCAPIRGMLGALGDMLLGPGVVVREHACAATGAEACRFRVDRVEMDNPG